MLCRHVILTVMLAYLRVKHPTDSVYYFNNKFKQFPYAIQVLGFQ